MRVVVWAAGRRRLVVEVIGGRRVAVLLDGADLAGLWPLPWRRGEPEPTLVPPPPR